MCKDSENNDKYNENLKKIKKIVRFLSKHP